MGKRFHGYGTDIIGTQYTYELWDGTTPYAPDISIELKIGEKPTIERQGEGDDLFTATVKTSRARVIFIPNNNNDYTNIKNISVDAEQTWALKILKAGTLYWVGRVLANEMRFLREDDTTGFAQIEISAVDALAVLGGEVRNNKKGYLVDPTWFTLGTNTDRQAIAVLICTMLEQAGLYGYWGASDNYLWSGILHDNTAMGGAYNALDSTVRDIAFVEEGDHFRPGSRLKWMTCKKAIEILMKAFGARIIHAEGAFYITQATAYDASNFDYYIYDRDGLTLATSNFTHAHALAENRRPLWEAHPTYYYQPPLREVDAVFKRQNGSIAEKTTLNTTAITCTHTNMRNGGALPGYVSEVDINLQLNHPASSFYDLAVRIKVYAEIPSSTKYQYNKGAWASTGSPSYEFVNLLLYPNVTAGTSNFKHTIRLPEPPTSATNIVCEVDALQYTKTTLPGRVPIFVWGTTAVYQHSFTGVVVIRQSYTNTEPYEFEQPGIYNADTDAPNSTNSGYLEADINFYNGRINDVGSIQVQSAASTWVDAGNWSATWTATTGDLPKILANQILGEYKYFVPVIRGNLHDTGGYTPLKSLSFDSRTWVLNGCTQDLQNQTWEGEWVGVDIDYTIVNDNGEGEKILTYKDERDAEIKDMQVELSRLRQVVGDVAPHVLANMINEGNGAPTSDPGADRFYNIKIKYDYDATNPVFEWQLNETSENAFEVISVSSTPYSLTPTSGEHILKVDTSGSAITINLPTAVGNKAKFSIKKMTADANAITLDGNGAQTIDGSTTVSYATQYQSYTIVSDNSNWLII